MARLGSKRRGSVAVMAMVMVLSTLTIALMYVSLSASTRTRQTRREEERTVRTAFDGGIDVIRDMADRGVLRMPQTVTFSVGDVQESLRLTDSSTGGANVLGITLGATTPLIAIDGTLTYHGKTWHMQKVVGRGVVSTVWQYAVYDHSGLTSLSNAILTTIPGYEGDAWFNGSLTLLNGSTHFGGSLTSTGLVTPSTMSVDGTIKQSAAPISFPIPVAANYQAAAAATVPDGSIVSGYTFTSPDASGYPILYCAGNLTLNGSFSGTGVIFATGNITIDADVAIGPTDHLVIIAAGNITVQSTANVINAYLYAGNTLTLSSALGGLTVQGAVVANNLNLNRDLTAGFDPVVRDNPVEAYKLKLPGVWP